MGLGADRGCECVGYQPHGPQGNEDTAATLNMLINAVRFTGRIGTVGVFVPQGPGAKGKMAKQGMAAIDFGTQWFKGRVGRRRLGGDYDALLLPGGTVNPDQLRVDKDAVSFVRDFVESGRPVAAICHGPWTVIEAGVVGGRTVTSFPSIRTDQSNAGAEVVDQDVVVDGNLIPSRSPDELPAFCDRLVVECESNSTQGEVLS